MAESEFHKQPTRPTANRKNVTEHSIPSQIGSYSIEALLEKGGMSFLYLGVHPETKDPLTIKTLSSEFVSNPEMVERFLREAEIIGLADHPNIVKLYGQGQWEGGLYIAMEFIQGISLREYLTHNLISLKHALEIVLEISTALCHLHAHGVIHRDLKPENILITPAGGVKVIDFGISQLLADNPGDSALQKKRLMGTPIYMSPEQKANPESASFPADIYSLGIIAYELILGKLSYGQIHLSIVPKGLQKILAKALQPELQNRYQDIVDFMTDLAAYMNSPSFLKENRETAPMSELSESLRKAQNSLVPQEPPQWPGIDLRFASYKSFGIPGLYYDFLELPGDAYGIIIGQTSVTGSPGIVYASVLRGMVKALSRLTQKPDDMATILNSLLLNDSMKQKFSFSYLILLPRTNLCRFISCGSGFLLQMTKENPIPTLASSEHLPLGTDPAAKYTEKEIPWHPGDSLALYACIDNRSSSDPTALFSAEQFQHSWAETRNLSPQKQVDDLLRKLKIRLSQSLNESSVFILSVSRNS